MFIKEIQAVHVRVPLETPYVYGRGAMTAFDSTIVRIVTDDGIVGYGESAPLFRSSTGDAAIVTQVINGAVAQSLLGTDPFDIEMIVNRVLNVARGNVDVVAGVDLALWDIMGKSLGQPVYRLIGGLCQDPIAVDYTLSSSEPGVMVEKTLEVHRKGFQGVVVKVTGESIQKDVQRVRSVREALPFHCTVRVDCNGAFSRDDAVQFLKKISDLNIEFVEQPISENDFEGLRQCRKVGIPISIDESLITLQDALTFVSHKACDVLNIKIPRVGGLFLAKRMAAIASAAGLPIVVGGRTALELSRCASRHFAASTSGAMGRKHEGPGPASQALSDDVVSQRTTIEMAAKAGGHVKVEQSAGLGVEVVWEKVDYYAVGKLSKN
jgi:L-alanine-DL-glutamate epimerase-like enolase superfamily enzyme